MSSETSFERTIAFAQDLIRLPSLSGDEGEVSRRIVAEMNSLGFERVRIDRAGNAIGVIPGTGEGPTIVLNCHMDTVAAGERDEWAVDPFAGEIADGCLHGRGAMDLKGPLAIQVHAAAQLAGELAGDVVVAHTVFEERGGLGMQSMLEQAEVEPDLVIIGEATHGDICIGHRGRAELEIVLSGLAGHASAPSRARNALDLLPATLEALARIAADMPSDPVLGPATMAPTSVECSPETRNVIPDRVVVVTDWRILPKMSGPSLVERVEAELQRSFAAGLPAGLSWSVAIARETQTCFTGFAAERELLIPGFLMPAEDPVVEAAARAVGRREGEGPAQVRPWIFATDGGLTHDTFGIPTIGFGPGQERFAHTNRERLELDEARWTLERYPALIRAVHDTLSRR